MTGMGRRRRAREMERRLRELDRWDELYGLGGIPPSPRSRPRRSGGSGVVGGLAVVSLLVAALAFPERAGQLAGWALDAGGSVLSRATSAAGADAGPRDTGPVLGQVDAAPQADRQLGLGRWYPPTGDRLLPAVTSGTTGAHAFLARQPGSGDPVGFSPCGPVEVVVNPEGAPEAYSRLVSESLARVSAASGLQLDLLGTTGTRWSEQGGEPGAPVLISWAGSTSVPELSGRTAGLGGATFVTLPDGRSWHASGQVVLDVDADLGEEGTAAVLDHELGHVLGLDHVTDPDELMAAENGGQTGFGPGDLEGLAALGAIDCP